MSDDHGGNTRDDDPTEFFWDLASEFLGRDGIEQGQLMGFPCLRVDGEFFATCDHRTGVLIVKLDGDTVAEMVESGHGDPFAPAGRVFKEWVAVSERDESRWRALMNDAVSFVSSAAER